MDPETTNATDNNKRSWNQQVGVPVWEQLATDQTDPWQVVPRQVFTPNDCLLISVAFVVLCRIGCFWVTNVMTAYQACQTSSTLLFNSNITGILDFKTRKIHTKISAFIEAHLLGRLNPSEPFPFLNLVQGKHLFLSTKQTLRDNILYFLFLNMGNCMTSILGSHVI